MSKAGRGTRLDERLTVDRIADPWGPRTPYAPSRDGASPWPARIDQFLQPGVAESDVERWVQSASVLHSNGDAMDIAVRDGRIVGVRGRARRSGQPRPPRAEGPVRLAGEQFDTTG